MKTQQTKQKIDSTLQPKAKNQSLHSSILQNYKDKTAQLKSADEEELLQGKFETTQLAREEEEPLQQKPNNTGLPDNLKSGVENLSGYSMDDVKVHYNSSQPATLQAHAYAQGTDIHIAPGQEKHLPHEVWHVVQQKQGRVKPTMQMKGTVPVNDDVGLEKEADIIGNKAKSLEMKGIFQKKETNAGSIEISKNNTQNENRGIVHQLVKDDPVVSVALDTDVESVRTDVNSAMGKLRAMILNNEDMLNTLNVDGRDRKIYAPIQSLWKKMNGLLRSWNDSWSTEDTCGLMLDIGLHLGKGVPSTPRFTMTEEMKESRRPEGVQGSNWERDLPEGTKTQSGVSATTIRLLKTLSLEASITALEIEAVMNGVCMYWDHSFIKKITDEYHTTAEVWAVYNKFLYPN